MFRTVYLCCKSLRFSANNICLSINIRKNQENIRHPYFIYCTLLNHCLNISLVVHMVYFHHIPLSTFTKGVSMVYLQKTFIIQAFLLYHTLFVNQQTINFLSHIHTFLSNLLKSKIIPVCIFLPGIKPHCSLQMSLIFTFKQNSAKCLRRRTYQCHPSVILAFLLAFE